ncbi:CBS domain-containing protein [Streptomyces avidinii]|uniref:CBS domain-containing protein n=1 Tax=Streptomyces TaxID=1883 RepID=UPI000F3A8B4F|nr:CBS domain-containing protein [Streptomyces sp. ADI95-16]AYV26345.1 CBS domain protein [Streptomyces sp. ADI95-16]
MRARDLAEPFPFVTTDDDAIDAARLLAEQSLPALLVLDSDGQPHAIVPGSQLIRQLIPAYIAEDPQLAGVVAEQHDGDLTEQLAGLTAAEWAPRCLYPPPVVGPDARPMVVAALMARTHSPLVAVIERDGDTVTLIGTVTAARLMQHFITAAA